MTRFLVLAAAAAILSAQQPPPPDPEQQSLRDALGEAGSSKVDFLRAIEKHLQKYPQTAQRSDLERAALSSAIEIRDPKRIVTYGERVLSRDPNNVEALERVSRYLLMDDAREPAKRALEYARHLETMVRSQPKPQTGTQGAARASEELAILLSKSFLYQIGRAHV